MDKENRIKLLLGILVASAFILFIIGIFFIGSKQNMFSQTFKISAVFKNLSGLRKGDYVRFAGVKAGVVFKTTFLNDSMIKVDFKMEKYFQELIKKDAVAYISTEGLVGNKIINIRPKWKSRESINENDTLTVINPVDTEEIIEKLIGTNKHAEVITSNLAKMSERINERKGILETLISDTISAHDFKGILKDVKATGNQLVVLSSDFEKIIKKINTGKGLAGTIINDTLIANELKQAVINLKISTDYSKTITAELTKNIKSNDRNTISLLTKDTVFAENLKQSIFNLQQSTKKLDENLEALKHSFLLKKYFKKSEKLKK